MILNLLNETLQIMRMNGLKEEDIIFIGSDRLGYYCEWDEFKVLADIEYDNLTPQVCWDLIIKFSNQFIMVRNVFNNLHGGGLHGWRAIRLNCSKKTKIVSLFGIDDQLSTLN